MNIEASSNIKRSSKLGFISKSDRKERPSETPGPGAYDPEKPAKKIVLSHIDPKGVESQIEVTPGPGDFDPIMTGTSTIKRIILGHIDPQGRHKEVEVTLGPGAYRIASENNCCIKRIILGVINPTGVE